MADWDFIGFTYNGYHSIRDLGIYRTSNGNRYDDNLTATMTDKVVDVPGGDGQYYFGTTFKNRTFTVNYAFDMLSEAGIRKLKEAFCGDGIHDLVFDERPYVAWSAKVTGTASMKHLCFEEDGERVYKGEGSITFTCYYPYGRTPKKLWTVSTAEDGKQTWVYNESDGKLLNNYSLQAYPNKNQWSGASKLNANQTKANIGDIPMPFLLTISRTSYGTPTQGGAIKKLRYKNDNVESTLTFQSLSLIRKDEKSESLIWDSQRGLIYKQELDGTKTLIPYSGQGCPKIPVGATATPTLFSISQNGTSFTPLPDNSSVTSTAYTWASTLQFDYLYR